MKISVKYTHAYDANGNIVDISSVTLDNKSSAYFSIGSHTPMVAALGDINQHHFKSKKGYQINPETELHQYAKKILKHRFETQDTFIIGFSNKTQWCSSCIFHCIDSELPIINGIKQFDLKKWYDTASIEQRYDNYIADVLLTSSSNPTREPIFLEVCVSHKCDEKKINSNNRIIEIDIQNEDDAYTDLVMSQSQDKSKIRFYNFKNLFGCEHYSDGIKNSRNSVITEYLPISKYKIKYYCIPREIDPKNAIYNYAKELNIGTLFASHEYGESLVFCRAVSSDGKKIVVLGKNIKGMTSPWIVYTITYNYKHYEHRFHLDLYNYVDALAAYNKEIKKSEEE